MKILITGASGFIGMHLLAQAARVGHEVTVLTRQDLPFAEAVDVFRWSLGEPLPEGARKGFDCAIHLAHDFAGNEGAKRTIDGTLSLMAGLRTLGVKRQIFYSSVSARVDAQSRYGRTKYHLERRCFDHADTIVIRPGLVLGEGGLFGRIRNWVRRYPLVPLPDGGRGLVSVVNVTELCAETLRIAVSDTVPKELNLFEAAPRSLRNLVLDEARASGRRVFIIPISSQLLLTSLRVSEALGLKLPVTSDNLAGFLANQSGIDPPS